MYSSIHTLYKITSERGQPLYKGQTGGSQWCPLFGGSTVSALEAVSYLGCISLESRVPAYESQTYYPCRFPDPTLRGSARYGYASERGGVYPPDADGFTKSTLLHKLGSHVNTEKEVRELHPYAAR